MRFIDDKGRLFGIVNLLDLLVVAVMLALISSAAINMMNRPRADKSKNIEIFVKVIYRVPSDVAHNPAVLKPGDRVLAGNAIVDKVISVKPVPGDSGYCDLVVLIKADCVMLNKEYYCANAPIKINSLITIANPEYIFQNGSILTVEPVTK